MSKKIKTWSETDLVVMTLVSAMRRIPRGSGYAGVPSSRSPAAILGTAPFSRALTIPIAGTISVYPIAEGRTL